MADYCKCVSTTCDVRDTCKRTSTKDIDKHQSYCDFTDECKTNSYMFYKPLLSKEEITSWLKSRGEK